MLKVDTLREMPTFAGQFCRLPKNQFHSVRTGQPARFSKPNSPRSFEGIECWSARELQEIFHYTDWRNFLNVIEKAQKACANAGEPVSDHFVDTNKMIKLAKGAERVIEDIALTRYACYLIAQNGDPTKNEVAFAQTYFAVQTRKQELIELRL